MRFLKTIYIYIAKIKEKNVSSPSFKKRIKFFRSENKPQNNLDYKHFHLFFLRSMVKMLPMGEFMDEFFNVAEMFNPLKLTDGEIGLFTSTLIICPGTIVQYL